MQTAHYSSYTGRPVCFMEVALTIPAEADTYDAHEAQRLTATVLRTAPLHGCLRRAVASACTTALIALNQDWSAEARAHFPQVFTELAGESGPLSIVR